ncbi:MAG: NRDE family protein [Planctomycetaceae bacterium]
MCILALVYQVLSDCPVLVAANRDESRRRRSHAPRPTDENPGRRWFGGRDGVSDGTWLGVNEVGLLATVTNRHDRALPANPRSRGLLCRDILKCEDDRQAESELDRQLSIHDFAGFNLLVVSADNGFVYEHGPTTLRRQVSAGLHVLGNTGWDDRRDPRSTRMRREFESALARVAALGELIGNAQRICGLDESRDEPALCISKPDSGTVSCSLLTLQDPVSDSEFHFAEGPPASTPFVDFSPQLRNLLNTR